MSDQTPPHPFARLPPSIRQSPEVVDAWLIDLSDKSRLSKPDSPRPLGQGLLTPTLIRAVTLSLLFATATGLIKPEVLIKLLPLLLKLALGGTI